MSIILFFIFIFGLAIGSFLNCLIWRLHTGERIPLTPFVKGANWRSHCPKCQKTIAWYDNIPVVSFILLGGRCRHCKQTISWQYPAIELITGILFVVAFSNNLQFSPEILQDNFQSIFNFSGFARSGTARQFSNNLFLLLTLHDWFLISVMIVIFVHDLKWYLILDVITLPACIIIFAFNLILGFSWQNILISGIISSSFFFLQFIISQGRWIGGGDIRLGLLIGLALGWPEVIIAVFLGYFIGSLVSVGLILADRKQWGSKVPLGVFLSTATIITMLWGEAIKDWYLGLF